MIFFVFGTASENMPLWFPSQAVSIFRLVVVVFSPALVQARGFQQCLSLILYLIDCKLDIDCLSATTTSFQRLRENLSAGFDVIG